MSALNLSGDWRALARRRLTSYSCAVDRTYRVGHHHQVVGEHLEAVLRGEIKRLMLFEPPRHGKSLQASKHFPAWALGQDPRLQIIATTYGRELADEIGTDVRTLLSDPLHQAIFPGSVIRRGSRSNRVIRLEAGGSFKAVQMGGAITGRGADILGIDDPVKDEEIAASAVWQERHFRWYQSVARTRLSPAGAIVLMTTRWNARDLAGRIIEAMSIDGEQWVVVNLPAFAEDNDILGRPRGAALWPGRWSKEILEAVKKGVGSRVWAALYQQRPSPEEGGIFLRQWWQWYETRPSSFDEIIQSWDLAFTDHDTSSWVVGQVWGRKGANCYLLDQFRAHVDFPGTIFAILRMCAAWPDAWTVLVENKANGPAVIASLKNKVPGLIDVDPDGDKVARAHAVTPPIEAGQVWLPKNAEWIGDYVEETAAFPNGPANDQVDATTQALHRFYGDTTTAVIDYWDNVVNAALAARQNRTE